MIVESAGKMQIGPQMPYRADGIGKLLAVFEVESRFRPYSTDAPSPHSEQMKAFNSANPGRTLTAPQCGQVALATSPVLQAISVKAAATWSAGRVRTITLHSLQMMSA